ncbi:signal recognition particle, SRP19 subunit [Tuber brumale]|nr:signal recognition particle, SRP19 subunit [Tuber brumale]
MSRNVRIEEVEDSDPEEMDISLFYPNAAAATNPTLMDPTAIPHGILQGPSYPQTQYVSADESSYKTYQCLYPVYFDSTRSRAEGRRVNKTHAIPNPLARNIVDACAYLSLKTVFEPGKTHPKDWANPGRVRVLFKADGKPTGNIKNKFLLLRTIGEFLKANPTRPEDPLRLRIPNFPTDGKPPEPPAVPRGWKVGTILPTHSAALSGGGVSDDIFKEMMKDMGMDAGGPGGGAAEKKEKKEKKDKKKGKR